jgi:hypothetical protein
MHSGFPSEYSTSSLSRPAAALEHFAAVAALRAHPQFPEMIRASAEGLVRLYQGRRLLDWLMDDWGRVLFGYFALHLHFARQEDEPLSGLTPTRMKALCAEFDVCSPGRVTVMLNLMRFAGYVAPAPAPDRRIRKYVATDRLIALFVARWRVHFEAIAPALPEVGAALPRLDDPDFVRALAFAMFDRFRDFRVVIRSTGLGLFGQRNAGILILASLLTSGEAGDAVPPTRPVQVSVSALARRFAVSRAHVLALLRDAADQGFIDRVGPDREGILILPRLAEAARDFFAGMHLFYADCARAALGTPLPEVYGGAEQASR